MKFKEMNGWSKLLFVLGWFGIVGSILCLILGVLFAANATSFGADYIASLEGLAEGVTGEELIKYSGISLAIVGAVSVVVAWLSVRAAKDNKKVMPALVFNAIDTVMNVVAVINTQSLSTYLLGVIVNGLGLVACIMILKNNKA